MQPPKIKIILFIFDNWTKKSIWVLGLAGIGSFISLPILAQLYPPMSLFQPTTMTNYPYRREHANYTYKSKAGNLVDTLKEQDNLDNLTAELEMAGLTKTLERDDLTILAPTDAAFDALPDEVFNKFSDPTNLKKVLKYHLISGKVTQEHLQDGEIPTLDGHSVVIYHDNGRITLNNAHVQNPSVVASNGVIIKIDRVLLPPDF
ncbi:MAG: fasciclin domain-containing protein [Pleurocapsa sp. MO_192.B19]|nr:fasciclin domain-containing protein [Pleurocapsa sp. MO_192.B19]